MDSDIQFDLKFLNDKVSKIPGWLNLISGAATFVLLQAQDKKSNEGNFVEIGVYGGKFLSILAYCAARSSGVALGLDTFFSFSTAEVYKNIEEAVGDLGESLILKKCTSQDLRSQDVYNLIGGKLARLIHIDGSHERDDVLWDLEVAEPLLTPSGILVIDDFFNPHDAGVTEAVFRFQILNPRPLLPIAYVGNKLFMCRHTYSNYYRMELESFLMSDNSFPQSTIFRDKLKTPGARRRMVETNLFGHPFLVVPAH
jgi:hypothetical protein